VTSPIRKALDQANRIIADNAELERISRPQTALFTSSTDTGTAGAHTGQRVTIVRPLGPDEADPTDVGPMYRVRAEDGVEFDAFEDELDN
jgi:hypothetical protein